MTFIYLILTTNIIHAATAHADEGLRFTLIFFLSPPPPNNPIRPRYASMSIIFSEKQKYTIKSKSSQNLIG